MHATSFASANVECSGSRVNRAVMQLEKMLLQKMINLLIKINDFTKTDKFANQNV